MSSVNRVPGLYLTSHYSYMKLLNNKSYKDTQLQIDKTHLKKIDKTY